jgi:diguanylate cyclase (GGDEF)-like protein
MSKFKEGRTFITIAHKLSSIIDADEIIFFDQGEIIERGSFDKLMAQRSRFYEFFEIEFGSFRYFSERLNQEVLRAKRYQRPFSLVMLELGGLGEIAASIGEEKLNQAFLELEGLIRKNIREVDFSTRYHKDRFLIALPETDFKHALFAVERIEKLIAKHIYLKGDKDIKFITLWGVSTIGRDATTITELYRNSEKMVEARIIKEQ